MKLIDGEKLIADLRRYNHEVVSVDGLEGLIELQPVQPDIIHCKDCKRRIRHDKRCGYWNHGVKPTMWCSQAKRREQDE